MACATILIVLGVLVLIAAVACAFVLCRYKCSIRDTTGALTTRLYGNLGAATSGQDVLGALAGYAVQQMKSGGWKDICDSVSISIDTKTTKLSPMDLSGVAFTGSSDPHAATTSTFVLPSCTKDAGVVCGACNCEKPVVWPVSGCDVTIHQGCGASCSTGGIERCCNMSAAGSVQYAVQLGQLQGIDNLFASATSTSCSLSADHTSLVVAIVLASGTVTMVNAQAIYRICTGLGNLVQTLTVDASATISGPVTLTIPFATAACSTTMNFGSSYLDCSKVSVVQADATVNGSSLNDYLEQQIVPLCAVLGVAGVAICATAIPFLVDAYQSQIDAALQTVAIKYIPTNALSSIAPITLPIPCAFCSPSNAVSASSASGASGASGLMALRLPVPLTTQFVPMQRIPSHGHQAKAIALPPMLAPQQANAIALPSILASAVGQLLSEALNGALHTLWTSKWSGDKSFPDMYFSKTMFASMPDAPQVSAVLVNDCLLDLNTCTMKLTVSSVKLSMQNVSLTAVSMDTVATASVTFACVVQAGVTLNYDPTQGGSLTVSLADIAVTGAAGSAQTTPPNPLTDLVNSLLQANNVATCLASFAIAAIPLPFALSAITLDKNLPIVKTICSGGIKFSCDADAATCAVADGGTYATKRECMTNCNTYYACTPDASGATACQQTNPSAAGAMTLDACTALCSGAVNYGDRVKLYLPDASSFMGMQIVSNNVKPAVYVSDSTQAVQLAMISTASPPATGPIRTGDTVSFVLLDGEVLTPFANVYNFFTTSPPKLAAFVVTAVDGDKSIRAGAPVRFMSPAKASPVYLGGKSPQGGIGFSTNTDTSTSWVLLPL